jgi:ABC-type nitrate/sulfonate/bicarbonate transport system permease component
MPCQTTRRRLRAAAGFAIDGTIDFSLGVAVGFSRIAGVLLDRTILTLRAIPFLAVLPAGHSLARYRRGR